MKTVYLCGPITGQSYEEARFGWRAEFAKYLPKDSGLAVLSPMRGKDFLDGEKDIKGDKQMYQNVMGTPAGIVMRDRNDVHSCDLMVANFLGAERVSIGSMVEFGWADAYRKPIILIMDDGNVHNHAFLYQLAGYHVKTVAEAAFLATWLLTPSL